MGVMAAAAYLAQMQALLPRGAAWARETGSMLSALLSAFAQECARLDARAHALLEEVDPRTASEMLGDWEAVLGLPDTCTAAETQIDARRRAAWRKLAYQAGQTPAFFVSLAATMGYQIVIHEFDPDVDDYAPSLAAEVAAGRWRFVWRVEVVNVTPFILFRAGSRAGERLLEGGAASSLECVFQAAKPAHTHVIFTYPTE
ncbi:YmfQ family protein [Sphingobium sp. sgz301303]|uniref:YmfQ family protein n=2 Tax=unclassified Sphingobium TaxID=2611147 RepID=UPI0035A7BA6A